MDCPSRCSLCRKKKRTRRYGDTIQSFSKIASEIRHGDHQWDHPSFLDLSPAGQLELLLIHEEHICSDVEHLMGILVFRCPSQHRFDDDSHIYPAHQGSVV